MKKILILTILSAATLLIVNCQGRVKDANTADETAASFVIPDDIMAIIDHSCYGCHNSESRNEKAKKDLKFDKLDSLKNFALIGMLGEIYEHVDSAKMPPPKFLERNPDRALTDEQKTLLMNWAIESSDDLSGK